MKAATCFLILFAAMASCSPRPTTKPESYREQHRLQFHFSPQRGWMNDPNGLVYYGKTYHLFYQHFPDSNVWGPMHWGHATSQDLVHWQHLPIALYPDSLGYIFSGSIVVDENNTTGFQQGDEKPLIAIFTYHDMRKEKAGRNDRESQGIAFSTDAGNTWTKYEHNPVLKNKGDVNFRDPKVLYHEPTKKWIMPLAVGDHLEIFSSPNLKSWTKESDFGKADGSHGGTWECPDLFPLKTADGTEKWVLIQNIDRGAIAGGSGTQYFVGNFDGKNFVNDNDPAKVLWLDYGADNYAGVTWFGAPDNRRIFIGWMSNWDDYATKVPTTVWRSANTVPRLLALVKTADGLRLSQQPVDEMKLLRGEGLSMERTMVNDSVSFGDEGVQKELDIQFDLSASTASELGFSIGNRLGQKVTVGFDRQLGEVFIDRRSSGQNGFSKKFGARHSAPHKPGPALRFHALIDNSSIEVFVDDGVVVLTDLFFPSEEYSSLRVFSNGGGSIVIKAELFPLHSIWNPQ